VGWEAVGASVFGFFFRCFIAFVCRLEVMQSPTSLLCTLPCPRAQVVLLDLHNVVDVVPAHFELASIPGSPGSNPRWVQLTPSQVKPSPLLEDATSNCTNACTHACVSTHDTVSAHIRDTCWPLRTHRRHKSQPLALTHASLHTITNPCAFPQGSVGAKSSRRLALRCCVVGGPQGSAQQVLAGTCGSRYVQASADFSMIETIPNPIPVSLTPDIGHVDASWQPAPLPSVILSLAWRAERMGAVAAGQPCSLDVILVLRVLGGNDIFITLSGTYIPSFYGLDLNTLCKLPRLVYSLACCYKQRGHCHSIQFFAACSCLATLHVVLSACANTTCY
jgi:hypothetical protein